MAKIVISFCRRFRTRGMHCGCRRNVEIKARVHDVKSLKAAATKLSDGPKEIIKQHDTFYNVHQGRLKLRQFEGGHGELIFYERPDMEGPKVVRYDKCDVTAENIDELNIVLERALGTTGIVKKTRELYMVGQTRVHVDCVDDLGEFMELEVVLKPEQTVKEGEDILICLMEKLGINKSDLLSGAYRDLLQKKGIIQVD